MKQLTLLFSILFLFFSFATFAQEDTELVEVYGLVVTKSDAGKFEYVPFATVGVEGSSRGTYANFKGMFSIVVKKGEKLRFSAVGFGKREITIPEDVTGMYYSLTVEMEQSPISIAEVTIFPWPNRDNLTAEFLAMQPTRAMELEAIAKDNLDKNQLMAIAENKEMDSNESAAFYLRKQASDYSYQGQQAPQPIFDPIAWGKFFSQWKKKKKMTEKEKKMIKILEGENE